MSENTDDARACPSCGERASGAYCERCGTEIDAPSTPPRSGGMLVLGRPEATEGSAGADGTAGPASPGEQCTCGGGFADGYCEQCGAPRPDPRAHLEAEASTWVAGVTDVGLHHPANQDAMALAADDRSAALVVCDGVSSALRSEDASQAAADAALEVLTRTTSTGVGVPSSLVPALTKRLIAATDAASDAVAQVTADILGLDPDRLQDEPPSDAHPSCTFVAAVVNDEVVVVGSVGDSRAYWIPDQGEALRLTTDDSWAEERIALGTSRAEAESGPGAHTITRWLGIDAPDHTPRTTDLTVDRPGWLVVCSDGLWNYASEAEDLAAVVRELARPDLTPNDLARDLVTWANAQGGRDNITVVLARTTGSEASHG